MMILQNQATWLLLWWWWWLYGNRWIFCLAPGSFRRNADYYLTKDFFHTHTHRIDQFKLTNWSIYGCRLLIGSLIFCVFFSLIKFDLMSLLFFDTNFVVVVWQSLQNKNKTKKLIFKCKRRRFTCDSQKWMTDLLLVEKSKFFKNDVNLNKQTNKKKIWGDDQKIIFSSLKMVCKKKLSKIGHWTLLLLLSATWDYDFPSWWKKQNPVQWWACLNFI